MMTRSTRRAPTPEYPLLALLLERPMHGYELYRLFALDLGHVWHLSQSQLYATLHRLQNRGWIQATVTAAERGAERHVFSLTPAGRTQAETWLHTPSRCSVQLIRLELPTRLYIFERLAPQDLPAFLARQRAEILHGLEELRAHCQAVPDSQPYHRMACTLRVHQLQALLQWFEETFPISISQPAE